MITRTRLKELLVYEPETGIFRWAKGRVGCRKGDAAGTLVGGYIGIKLDRRRYLAHQLAFLYMTGQVPIEVDHKNRCRSDNRWTNLRTVTRSQNHANVTKPRGSSASGVRGVALQKTTGRWFAHIQFEGKRTYLGTFSTIEEAARVRRDAELSLFGEYAALS